MERTNNPTKPGYYWWLPQYMLELGRGDKGPSWSIVTVVPEHDLNTNLAGEFVGPLEAPVHDSLGEQDLPVNVGDQVSLPASVTEAACAPSAPEVPKGQGLTASLGSIISSCDYDGPCGRVAHDPSK